jgi:RES domain-containing protein
MGQYVKAGDPPRVLLTYEVGCCRVVDLRHEEAGAIRAQAEQPWLAALARGEEPASWRAADEVRGLGAVGLVDPSRRQPGLWHVTLFRWNEPGAPAVIPVGRALPLEIVPVPGS